MDNFISYNYIQVGKQIWYKNPQDSPTDMPYLSSTVKSKDDVNKKCHLLNNESIQYSNTLPFYNDININIDDLSLADDINEMDILNNILNRYYSKIYFTNIGDILLYLNPYINKEQTFSDKILFLYNKKNFEMQNTIEVQPHLYKNIYNIIKKLKDGKVNNQTILIQGEGCTGKTEIINQSIKYILNYLENDNDNNNLNNNNEKNNDNDKDDYYSIYNYKKFQAINNYTISKKIIASNIILDAFGNAKTLNSDNSTRFIKYLKLKFNKSFTKITGTEFDAFLFDKNRVSNLEANKGNNFNVFYYLIKCGNNDLLRKLFLFSDNITSYNYLNSKNATNINNSSYTKNNFKEFKEALIILGFNNGEMFTIFKILAAIILLGNIEIIIDNNLKLMIKQKQIFLNICNLLNIDYNEFTSALINQEESMGNKNLLLNEDNNIVNQENNYNYYNENEEIVNVKNNFANELYNQLFLWIKNKINNNLNQDLSFENEEEKIITLFDFCGYENNYSYKYNDIVYLNSLEQLFINYINEFIFYFYLKDYYLTNLKLYQKEGINYIADKVENEYNNKKDILNSINYLLNDFKNMQSDKDIKTFISNLEKDTQIDQISKKKFKKVKSSKMIKNSTNSNYFVIHHTNEDVFYNIKGFLYKNVKNFIPWNLLDCLLKSSNPIIRNIYKNNRKNTIKETNYENYINNYNYENIINSGFVTLGEEFKYFIKNIKKEIKQSQRNYIICLKSNQNQKPLVFTPKYVFNQLKYFQILFSIKQLEKNIYPVIINFIDFYKNFYLSQNLNDVSDFEELIKYNKDTNSINSTDIYKKKCIKIINNLIHSYNKYNKENILLNEDLILFGKRKLLMKEKLYKILEKENNRRIEIKSKAVNNIIRGMDYINQRTYYKEIKNQKVNNKILLIKEAVSSFYNKNKMEKFNGLMYFLQNSLRVICARKKLENIKDRKLFLIIRLKLYLEAIKKKNNDLIENENKNENDLINNNNDLNTNRKSKKNIKEMKDYFNNNKQFKKRPDSVKKTFINLNKLKINNSKELENEENVENDLNDDNNENNISGSQKDEKTIDELNGMENNDNNNEIDKLSNGNENNDNYLNDNISREIIQSSKSRKNKNNQKNENANIKESLKDKDLNNNKLSNKKKDKRLTIINPKNFNDFINNKFAKNDKNKESKNNSLKKPLNINQIKCKSGLKIFQENFLFYKIIKHKKNIKTIYNFAMSRLYIKKYLLLKNEIKIIQKYIKKYLERQNIINKAIYNYMNNFENNSNEVDKKINAILFPYRQKNINKEKKVINKSNNEEHNKSINANNEIRKNKNNKLSTYEKYLEYKKKNQLYNYSQDKNKYNNNVKNLKEEEKDMNNYLNSEEKEKENDINIIYKLIKDIPDLSNKNNLNLSNDLFNSSSYENTTKDKEKEKFYNNKIYLLSKIIDIDILTEIPVTEDFDQILWAQEYKKIYEFNLINKTPIQQIYLSDSHSLLINNIGNIFLIGMNDRGQCAFNSEDDNDNNEENKNIDLKFIYSDISISLYQYFNNLYGNIKEAILGDGYTVILNNKGKTYSFGDYFNLNYLNTSNNNSIINSSFINGKNLQNIKSIHGKGNLNIYLNKNNDIYLKLTSNKAFLFNDNNNSYTYQNRPIQMLLDKSIKISSISCGYNFYILLSSNGKVYSGGTNDHGELCSNDNNTNPRLTPEEIYEVTKLNEKIIQISCGFKHAIILTNNNNVYGWGNNSYGQLFSKEIKKKSGIIKLNNNTENKIIQISAGFRSSFIMNDNHEIYYFGILNCNKKNISENGERIYIEEKNNEYGNKGYFVPVKINNRWNKIFSLFYVTFADIRNLSFKIEYKNKKNENENIKNILKIVSSKWLMDSLKVPYIPEVSQYFNQNYMEKSNKNKNTNYYY